jgi:hypothetical protein
MDICLGHAIIVDLLLGVLLIVGLLLFLFFPVSEQNILVGDWILLKCWFFLDVNHNFLHLEDHVGDFSTVCCV